MHSEDAVDYSFMLDYVSLSSIGNDDVIKFIEAVKPFLRIYMNYKKDSDGITLYANYQNFINSPFVKLQDNRLYVDTVPGTFAKISPG